jgi:hypothetical protein
MDEENVCPNARLEKIAADAAKKNVRTPMDALAFPVEAVERNLTPKRTFGQEKYVPYSTRR